MSIQIGQPLPDIAIKAIVDGRIEADRTGALYAGRKAVLFAVPGAFTPTCSEKHLPGYVQRHEAFHARDIAVHCLAVNDAYVMQAWAAAQKVPPGLVLLADGNADFTRALGLELDGSSYGMGLRARRFALYAENGGVRQLHVEAPGEFRVSGSDAVRAALGG